MRNILTTLMTKIPLAWQTNLSKDLAYLQVFTMKSSYRTVWLVRRLLWAEEEGQTPTGFVLVMKPELHCLGEDKKNVVGGTNGLKLSTMLASGWTDKAFDSGIKGRMLLIRSKYILKNCKKALALILCHDSLYKSYASTGLLPSGMRIKDNFLYI